MLSMVKRHAQCDSAGIFSILFSKCNDIISFRLLECLANSQVNMFHKVQAN